MIITIDGPAGSGKSTVARMLAARLDVAYLDTGAMYRAIACTALERGVDFTDESSLIELARSIHLDVECGPTLTHVLVDGVDLTDHLRSMTVNSVTSRVAKCGPIRAILVEQQRRIGQQLGSLVTEGRDQGSVVFPHADHKFVLDASLARRAERRFQEMISDGETVSLSDTTENLRHRDQIDSKQWEPLLRSGVAQVIDTTNLSLVQVVERIMTLVGADVEAEA